MNEKILIVGAQSIDKLRLAKIIVEKNDNLSIGMKFTSDLEYKDKVSDDYMSYLDNDEINLAFKNNVILYVSTKNYVSEGITLDSFYNSDVFEMSISNFNNISENTLIKYNILVIWLDTKNHSRDNLQEDILETKYLVDRLDYTDYMYFLDEDFNDVADTILEYLSADEERRQEIREENL